MIEKIKLKNFRKFSSLDLDCKHKIIVITGANATGKTSILEAIYIAATSRSHRTTEIESIIQQNKNFTQIDVKTDKNYQVIISKEGKKFSINQITYSKISDFIGRIPVLMFSPTDLELIRGSKGIRRKFLDLEISLLDRTYLKEISIYKKILKERNELLKNYQSSQKLMLDILTQQLSEWIDKLYKKRSNFINQLNIYLKDVCGKLECEKINLIYQPTYDCNNINFSFSSKLNYDLISKTTNIGLHRDDFFIYINNQEALEYASEGQSRMIVLAIKLALKKIYDKENKNVILLLDDVFASMDQKRINHIMEYIKNEQQTIITTTSLFNIPDELIKDAKIVKL